MLKKKGDTYFQQLSTADKGKRTDLAQRTVCNFKTIKSFQISPGAIHI